MHICAEQFKLVVEVPVEFAFLGQTFVHWIAITTGAPTVIPDVLVRFCAFDGVEFVVVHIAVLPMAAFDLDAP
ncbi:MAG: hypothetical protein WC505_07670 [Patescibacteria group bacterium]